MTQNKGRFNLDFEESVLLRSRLSRKNRVLQYIAEKARKILRRKEFLPSTSVDDLKEIRDKADGESID